MKNIAKSATSKQSNTRHKMALITFIALVPLVYFIPDIVRPFLPENKLINVIVTVGLIVPVISYGVTPLAQKLLVNE